MNRRCPNCGKEVSEGQALCDNCGAALPSPTPSPSPASPYDLDIPPPPLPPKSDGRDMALGIVIGFFAPWVFSFIGGTIITLLGKTATSFAVIMTILGVIYIGGALTVWLSTRKRYPRFAKSFLITILIVYGVVGAVVLGALLLCTQVWKGL